MTGHNRSEFDLIEHIRRVGQPSPQLVLRAIGDDAAVIDASQLRRLTLSTDTLVEGTHFRRNWMSPYFLGRKSCLVNVSDLAAMGAVPLACLLNLTLPSGLSSFFFDEFVRGFQEEAKRNGLALLGGDLCRGGTVSVTVTVWGNVEEGEPIFRTGAEEEHKIALIGKLGWSRVGLEWLLDNDPDISSLRHESQLEELTPNRELAEALKAHFIPTVPLQESLWLQRHSVASSMIDVSDGLVSDLGHIAEESQVTAILSESSFELQDAIDLEHFLHGGEDYALLLTLSETDLALLEASYPREFLQPRVIGHIEKGESFVKLLTRQGRKIPVSPQGFDHFR